MTEVTYNTTIPLEPRGQHAKYLRAVAIVSLVLVAATSIAGLITRQAADLRLKLFFDRQADQIANTYYNKLNMQITVLEGLRGLWNVDGRFTPKSFETYLSSMNLDSLDKSGASSYFYAPLIEESYPITHIYPLAGRESALGVNFGRESERVDAIAYARDSNNLATTKNLILQTTSQPGFFFLLPLYKTDLPIERTPERKTAFAGVVVAAFRSESAFEQIFGGIDAYPYLDFQVYQGDAITPDRLLYDHDESFTATATSFTATRVVRLYDQTWTIEVQGKPSLMLGNSEERLPLIVFASGLIATAIVVSTALLAFLKHLRTHQS